MSKILNYRIWIILSLTIGLAPFFPEPHLWGKIKWVWGGAVGMQGADWFDLFFHAAPWFMLIISLLVLLSKSVRQSKGK